MNKTIPSYFSAFSLVFSLLSCTPEKAGEHAGHEALADSLGVLARSPGKMVVSSQNTVRPMRSSFADRVTLSGYIAPDERRTYKITSRFGGRIEKLYVKYPWQRVDKGTKLLEVYSPELNTHAEEYLYLWQQNDTLLLPQAREKLLLLGLTETQLRELERSGTAPFTITVYAPRSGFILPAGSDTPSAMNMPSGSPQNQVGMNMGGGSSAMPPDKTVAAASGWLREGMYIGRDQVLFGLNDLDEVWGMALGNAVLLSGLGTGTHAIVHSEQRSGPPVDATVDFIEPLYDSGQKFTRVRLYMHNPGHVLQVNSLFQATIQTDSDSTLTLPGSAVYDLGKRSIVWIKKGRTGGGHGIFQAMEVTTGKRANGRISILTGLGPDDEVAEHAGMLLDSETLVR